MAAQLMNARSAAAPGCALIEAEHYLGAPPSPVPRRSGECRPSENMLDQIEVRQTKDGPQ
jgi:hypothetical protein